LFIGTLSKISFDNQAFTPIGVSYDVESININNWKSYIVLMALTGFENRLSKICFSNNSKGIFIKVKFDEECSNYVNVLEKNNVFPKHSINNEINNKIKDLEKKVFETQIINNDNKKTDTNNKISSENSVGIENITSVKQSISSSSFLETSVASKSTSKLYSVTQLADKFSVDELSKIKSIIKFAKKNKITDKIYNNKGDITLEELLRQNGKQMNSTETENVLELLKKDNSKIENLEHSLKIVLNELSEIKGKIVNITLNTINPSINQKSSEISRLTTASYSQVKDDNSLSRLLASTNTDEFNEEDDFIDKPKITKTNPTNNNNIKSNSNLNRNRVSNYSPSKNALKPKPLPSSHLYTKSAAKASTNHPAPAPPSNSFNNQQFKQLEKTDDFDDDDAFLSP
jgi:hypothetical protein